MTILKPDSVITKTIPELTAMLSEGKITSRELTEEYIKHIQAHDGDMNGFVTTTFDLAREMADASDSRREQGTLLSPLDGLPMNLKDVVCTKGIRTTASSNVLKDFVPPYNATLWDSLRDAGVVLLGKVNTDEFTMGSSTESSAFGVTRNPHDLERVSGGSSGGSAATVAAHMGAATIATDTGGSIRQPASFCGVTGLKTSYGRVSRYGMIPMVSSLDTPGPMAKTPEGCAMILQVIAGKDQKDGTTVDKEVPDYLSTINDSISGMRVGIPAEYMMEGMGDGIMEVFNSAKAHLENLGAEAEDVSLPHTKYAMSVYYIMGPAEISANMSRYDGIRYGSGKSGQSLEDIYKETREDGFGPEIKRRIMIGTYVLSSGNYDAFFRKTQKVRTLVKEDFDKVFNDVDILLTPVVPNVSFKVGEKTDDPVKMYLQDAFLIPANLAGICSISVPVGTDPDGLPIGVQIMGPAFKEERILRVAHQLYNSMNK